MLHRMSLTLEPPDPSVGWIPCRTEQDCPYLCGDAGYEKAKDLCYKFGGIGPGSLWDGMFFDEDVNEIKASIVVSEERIVEKTSRSGTSDKRRSCLLSMLFYFSFANALASRV